jgi:Phage tail lysozyme
MANNSILDLNLNFGSSFNIRKEDPKTIDRDIQLLSSTLQREYNRIVIAGRSIRDPYITKTLENVDVNSKDLISSIKTIDKNTLLLDNKIRVLDRNIRTASTLLEYNKRILDKTNSLLSKATAGMSSSNNYKKFNDFENKLENTSLTSIDRIIDDKLKDYKLVSGGSRDSSIADNLIQAGLGSKFKGAIAGIGTAVGGVTAIALGAIASPAGAAIIGTTVGVMIANEFLKYEELTKAQESRIKRLQQEFRDRYKKEQEDTVTKRSLEETIFLQNQFLKTQQETQLKEAQKEQEYFRNKKRNFDMRGQPIVPDYGRDYMSINPTPYVDSDIVELYGNVPTTDPQQNGSYLPSIELQEIMRTGPKGRYSKKKKSNPGAAEIQKFLDTLKESRTYDESDLDPLMDVKNIDEKINGLLYQEYSIGRRMAERAKVIEDLKRKIEELKRKPKGTTSSRPQFKFGEKIADVASLGGDEFSLSTDLRNHLLGTTSVPNVGYENDIETLKKSADKSVLENYFKEYNYYTLKGNNIELSARRLAIAAIDRLELKSSTKLILDAPEIEIIGNVTFKQLSKSGMGSSEGYSTPRSGGSGGYSSGSSGYDWNSTGISTKTLLGNDVGSFPSMSALTQKQFGLGQSYSVNPGGAAFSGNNIGSFPSMSQLKEDQFGYTGGNIGKYTYDYFIGKGYSPTHAAAIVGNLAVESANFNPKYIFGQNYGDRDSLGIAQWRTPRQKDFERIYGKPFKEATLDEQLSFIDWELHNTEAAAGRKFFAAENVEDAAAAFDKHYERSSGEHRSRRINSALKANSNYAGGISPTSLSGPNVSGNQLSSGGSIPTAGLAPIEMANSGKTRDKPITEQLNQQLQDAVAAVYGPGYKAQVYSGGQDGIGEGGKRTGSTRHDHGNAADVYIIGPDGKRVMGDGLNPLTQYWIAKGYGSAAPGMADGGIHLDTHTDRATTWSYGHTTEGNKEAAALGAQGILPENLYSINQSGEVLAQSSNQNVQQPTQSSKKAPAPAPVADKEVARQKSTHDNINMSASSLANYAAGIVA